MLKLIRNAGYVQGVVGLSLLSGFLITAFHTAVFSFLVFSLIIVMLCISALRDTAKQHNNNPNLSYNDHLKPVSYFYGVIVIALLIAFIVGLIVGAY